MSNIDISEKTHYVYEIKFPDGKVYVGCTSNYPQRIKSHHNKPSKMIDRHMKKEGFSLFSCHISCVGVFDNKEDGLKFEKKRILELHEQGRCINRYTGKKAKPINIIKMIDGSDVILFSNGDIEPFNDENKKTYLHHIDELKEANK